MTQKEYLKRLDRIYRWYDGIRKKNPCASGSYYLSLLKEKNRMILDSQKGKD